MITPSKLQHQSPTRRLTILYICALGSVALLTIIGQIFIQIAIQQQSSDALIINIAGRQRMLSQKISKTVLFIELTVDPSVRTARAAELQQALTLWQHSQQGLQQGDMSMGLPGNNSSAVTQLFSQIEPQYDAMVSAAQSVLSLAQQNQGKPDQLKDADPYVQTVLNQEEAFLTGMNQIVSQYQNESEGRVSTLRTIELTLFGITLLVLTLEGSIIFRHTTSKLSRTILEIVELQQAIANQKHELENGIQQILEAQVHMANGDFSARAPLAEDHVLWQVAYSLNNLISRLQRLNGAEVELQQMKLQAAHTVGSLQTQVNQIKSELQLIHAEASRLVGALRVAKMEEHPISLPPSRTLLDPLCKELAGNYLCPALSTGHS